MGQREFNGLDEFMFGNAPFQDAFGQEANLAFAEGPVGDRHRKQVAKFVDQAHVVIS
jgi:hypothetical protein